ncbi:MAG TPA: DUF4350 domain-containing protein [Bryobacteraceae bacterium]|nr:DUF4350 domain-containing protein [Bryobacteraceae bacterium]
MRFGWLKTRQTKYSAYAAVYILVIIAVLAAANWLANRHNKSVDTTSNKRFSLSDQTEKVVRNLKQDVKVTVFDRSDEFGRYRDLLDRYDTLSTKFHVEYVDPVKKPTVARAAGVRSLGTIYVQSGLKREEAKTVSEEEITGALIRSLKTGERNVCFVTGSGEKTLADDGPNGFSRMKELLEKNNYKTREISLLEKPEVPKDCTILVVGGPTRDYVEQAANAIRTYVENGGRVLFMVDPPLGFGKQEAAENPALVKLLADWGVTLHRDLALDTSGVGQLFGLGPEVPLVATYESHPIVREMKGSATIFPLVRTMEVKSIDKATVETLFSTSENSYATASLGSSEIRIDPKKDKKGPLPLAAAGTVKGHAQGRFVVVGGSGWATNNFLPARTVANSDLFLNVMNWLSSDEDLIAIRPKDPEDRKLSLTRAQMSRVLYASLFGLPLLVLASGLFVWWRRRA